MSYIYEKTITSKTVITRVDSPYLIYHQIAHTTQLCCGMCEIIFKPDSVTHLGLVPKGSDMLLCDHCAKTVLENGAQKLKR